ncbi:hypothetical protein PV390_05255 [Streptomyces sp. ME02-6991-2A]|uniref:hypothetical protein n=1 Tax=Streptomyces sp. ME02-6991-2A TaxID=3028677 RepID=UPI0029AC4D88|nr:hypothetical protein [Streptomyces sp. ME02-6991-2A]MDX3373810.1 hypothetical protein [Streptomyces sp. ME02-6991-2A]
MTWPSAQAEDIGARLKEPFSFSVESSTTGVPKYRMLGSMAAWAADVLSGVVLGVAVFMGVDRRVKTLRPSPKDRWWMMDGDEKP